MLRYFTMLMFLVNISSALAEPIVVEEKMTDSASLQRAREKVNQLETPTSIVGGVAKGIYEDMKSAANSNEGKAQESAARSCKSEGNCFRVTGSDSYFTGGKYTKIVCLAGYLKDVEMRVHYDDKGHYTTEIGSIIRHDSLEKAALETCNLNYY